MSTKRNVIVIISILVVSIQCAFFASTPRMPPDRFHITVASKIKPVYPMTGHSYDLFEYYVGNKKYQDPGETSMPWAPKGEKYLFRYDKLHPENQECTYLITEHPVFLPEEMTAYTYGTLEKISRSHESFDFKYTILEKKYERVQNLAFGDPVKNHPQLVNGAEFLVEYWVQNPQRAILYMDKPKRDGMPFPLSPDIHVLRPVWDSIPVLLPSQHMF